MISRLFSILLIVLAPMALAQELRVGAAQPNAYLSLLENKNVALVVNQTSTVSDRHLVDFLLDKGVNILRVMAPEHGFRGDAGAGEHVADGKDEKTGLPILSLYGSTKKPTPAMLNDIDVLIFDIQDVGTRFYTYISTLHLVMEAAAQQNVDVIVLDRPNPNGRFVDGPIRQPGFESFVGMDPIPLLHGMTVGELAKMIKGEEWIDSAGSLNLTVIPIDNYQRNQPYSLPVPPSPNLPNDQAIRLYPSLCLFEATQVSVGRGTPFPFQVIGHNTVELGDFRFTPHSQSDSAVHPKLEDKTLWGKDLRNSDIAGFDLGLLIATYHQFERQNLSLIDRPDFFDKLSGTDALRLAIEAGQTETQIRQSWQADLLRFRQQRAPYLLYPDN